MILGSYYTILIGIFSVSILSFGILVIGPPKKIEQENPMNMAIYFPILFGITIIPTGAEYLQMFQ